MRASVYRVRASGARLPRPSAPVDGELRMDVEQRGDDKFLVARLLSGARLEVLPALLKAQVLKVSAHGMVIQGVEAHSRGQQKSRVRFAPQTWWVFIVTEHAAARFESLDPMDTLDDEVNSISKIRAAGYSD